jgi:hypothetical protein
MKKALILTLCLAAASRAVVAAPNGSDPRERNFKLLVDGVQIDGVVGYRIDFSRVPVSLVDQRRLGVAYSPDQRRLVITITQKGLNRLQDWLNGATDTATPVTKAVSIQALDNQDQLLARWELTGVIPSTFSSAAAGNISEVDATVEFLFDRLRLAEANGK